METKDTGKRPNVRMTRVQKVIVILTAAVLTIILIAVATTRYMGGPGVYPIEADQGTSSSEENTVPSKKDTSYSPNDTANSEKGTSDSGSTGIGGNGGIDPGNNNRDPGGTGQDTSPETGNGNQYPDRVGTTRGQILHRIRTREKPNDGSGSGKDDTSSGGISSSDTVSIISIGDSTVTVKIGKETIVIPVQTTVFNGRITKSGVASDSLCGYSVGGSVLLYYSEGGSLAGVTLTGSYVKADNARLTVSGDYNGDGSKIVFRLNGVKLP